MTISQLFIIIRARLYIFWTVFLFVVISAAIVCIVLPKKYKASATVIVNYKWADPISGLTLPAQLMPGYMATQVDIITSKDIALKVVDELKLQQVDTFKQDFLKQDEPQSDMRSWLADWLIKRVEVTPSRTSSVIEIAFKGKTPEFAASVANTFAKNYIDKTVQLKVEPSRKAASYYTAQVKELQTQLEQSQQKLLKYQQDHQVVNIDGSLDIENARLSDLSSKLVAAQSQSVEANSRQRSANNSSNESPDIASDALVQSLKTQLAEAETKMADVAAHYAKNHPLNIAAQAQIDKLKTELNKQISVASKTVSGSAAIYTQNLEQTRSALEAQKKKVLELNSQRRELSSLTRDVDTAQKAYTAATDRFNQSNFEGQSNQSDITLLNAATVPLKPSSPKTLLIMAAAILLGIFGGLSLSIISELFDRRVRSTDDMLSLVEAPLLGVVPQIKLKRTKWTLAKALSSNQAKKKITNKVSPA